MANSAKEEAEELYCVCRKPYQDNEFMIQCDACKDWFHGRWAVEPRFQLMRTH